MGGWFSIYASESVGFDICVRARWSCGFYFWFTADGKGRDGMGWRGEEVVGGRSVSPRSTLRWSGIGGLVSYSAGGR